MSRAQQTRNEDFHKECPKCVNAGVYDSSQGHSSSRRQKCKFHNMTLDEQLNIQLGKDYERYVRKLSLNTAVSLEQPYKAAFIDVAKQMTLDVKALW